MECCNNKIITLNYGKKPKILILSHKLSNYELNKNKIKNIPLNYLNTLKQIINDINIPYQIGYLECIKCSFDRITSKQTEHCKRFVFDFILQYQPEIIITMGNIATKMLLGNIKLTSNLNQLKIATINDKQFKVIPTYHLVLALKIIEYIPEIKNSFYVAKNIIENKQVKYPNMYIIETEQDFNNAFEYIKDKEMAIDFETNTTQLFSPNFSLISLSIADGINGYFIKFDDFNKYKWAEFLLQSINKYIFHNYLFDGIILKKVFDIQAYNYEDTLLQAYIEDEVRPKNLKYLSSIFLGLHYGEQMKKRFKKKEDLNLIDINELATYNILDSYATYLLNKKFLNNFDNRQHNLYKLLKKFQRVLFEMIYNGFPVDVEYIKNLIKEFKQKEQEVIQKLNNLNDKVKYARKIAYALHNNLINKDKFQKTLQYDKTKITDKETALLPTRTIDILCIFASYNIIPNKKTNTGNISTDIHTLQKYNLEEFKLILEARKYRKLYSTYLTGLINKIGEDGKIHASYSLTNTATGRTSSSNPNLQNITRDKIIKNIFIAERGYKIIQYDWSQIELRVACALSKEENMLKAYLNDIDLHKVSASKIFKKPIDKITPEERQLAKSVSFGVLYGMSAKSLAESFNLDIKEAEKIIKEFFDYYKNLKKWQECIIAFCKKHHKIYTVFGRCRHLYNIASNDPSVRASAIRQAINTPIQATASDINLFFLYKILNKIYKNNLDVKLVGSVHDSGIFLVKETLVDMFINLLQNTVEEVKQTLKFLNNIPLKIDISIGDRWGELKEV